jgi:hypothetical protein
MLNRRCRTRKGGYYKNKVKKQIHLALNKESCSTAISIAIAVEQLSLFKA